MFEYQARYITTMGPRLAGAIPWLGTVPADGKIEQNRTVGTSLDEFLLLYIRGENLAKKLFRASCFYI